MITNITLWNENVYPAAKESMYMYIYKDHKLIMI